MTEEMECQTCRFWDRQNSIAGRCRRNAPKPMGWVEGNDDEDHIPHVEAVWPVTFFEDFCGEWVKRG